MDISLEDFIKTNPGKVSRGGRGGRKVGGGGGRGAGRGGGGVGRGGLVRKSAGGIGGGGRGGLRRSGGRASFGRSPRGAADGMWVHDKFQDAGLGRRTGGFRTAGGAPGGAGGGAKITVSNLHFGVSDADIIELFGEIGPIRYASVHYDRSGRSMGKADVVFERRGDAQQAINQYNGVPLDGRAMVITFANAATVVSVSPQRAGGLRQVQGGRIGRRGTGVVGGGGGGGRGAARGGRGRGAGGRGAGRGGGKKPTATPTAAELDAELDAYISANPK